MLYHFLDSLYSITTALIFFFIWNSIVAHIIPHFKILGRLDSYWQAVWQTLWHGDARDTPWSFLPYILPHFLMVILNQLYWAYLFTWMYECSTLSVALLPLYVFFVSFICTSFPLACLCLCIRVSFLESKLKCQFSEAFPRTYFQTKLICRSSTP